MSKTPLLTVRCPQDIVDGISATMNATGLNKTEVVVDMLRNSVPSLPIMERAKLPKVSAIYFVITPSNKLLYIGQSKNLFNRWLQHHRYQQFIEASPDTRVAWFEFDESDRECMPVVEDELITLLDTEYNGTDAPQIKKPRITAYVRQDLFDKFNEFCEQYEVKHSKGIELVLAEYFTGNKPDVTLDPKLRMGVSEERVKALIDERLEGITPIINTGDAPNNLVTKEDLQSAFARFWRDEKNIETIASKLKA